MIEMTLKSRSPRPRFRVKADLPRPARRLGFGDATGKPRPAAPADSMILRRWIAHQATTYNNLLKTIAAAPVSQGERA